MWAKCGSILVVLGLTCLALPARGEQSSGANPSGGAGGGSSSLSCVILVSSPEQPQTKRGRAVFSATEILDLEFGVLLPGNLEAEHLVELKVHTPRGHLYQSLTVPFTAQCQPPDDSSRPGQGPQMRSVPNHPYPVEEKETVRVHFQGRRYARVTARLPVAGTSITISSLYGQWSVEAYLDGSNATCSPKRSFTLTE